MPFSIRHRGLYYVIGFLIGWLLFTCVRSHADPATHRLPDQQRKMQVWFGDRGTTTGFLVSNCLPSISGTTTIPSFACEGYTKNTTTGELEYVSQDAHTIGPLSGGSGKYYLAIHADTSSTVSGWTRQAGTHYLWKLSTNPPILPSRMTLIAQATVLSTAISAIADMRMSNPGPRLNVRDPLWGCTGDGVTADTLCMQRVADRLKNVTTNQEQRASLPQVDIPQGIYLITDTINWGGTLGVHLVGAGASWDCTIIPGATCFKWGGAANKPMFWFFQNTFDVVIEGLGFYGADMALLFRNVASTIQNGKVKLSRLYFSQQTNSAIWIGYDFADTTSTADMTNFMIEDSYFDPSTLQAVVCNVANNFYGLFMTRNHFFSHATLINQGCQNISITDSIIIANGTQATTDYPITLVSGGGWFNLANILTENALLLHMAAWNGSAGLFATLTNVTVNSQQTYADIGNVPTIILNTPTVLTNVQVSSPTGPLIRHIDARSGYVKIGGAYLDVYDTQQTGVFLGLSPDGKAVQAFQRPDTNSAFMAQRNSDSSVTGNVFELSRYDKASNVMRIGANGDVVTTGVVQGTQGIFTGLATAGAATGKYVVCIDSSTLLLYRSSTGTDCSN